MRAALLPLLPIVQLLLALAQVEAQNYSPDDTTTVYNTYATYYADKFVGRKTSSGEVFTQDRYTAAHYAIKLGTLVLVENPKTGQQVIVKVNDRCPRRGVIDLTRKAIQTIGIKGSGKVAIRILPESYRQAWESQGELLAQNESQRTVEPEPAGSTATVRKETSSPKPTAKPASETKPAVTSKPTATPAPKPAAKPAATPAPKPAAKPAATPAPKPAATPKPAAAPETSRRHPVEPVAERQSDEAVHATPAPQPAAKPKPDPNAKYDLLLATGVPRSQAEHYVAKLPMNLRENAQLKPDLASGKLTLTLPLSASLKKAEATRNKLLRSFPDCQLVAAE